jgi:hypothetical protein
MKQRVHIDRLDLDLRGIDPVLAAAAVRLLGPALEARLSGAAAVHRGADAHALAHHLAERVARQLQSSSKDADHAARRID